MAEIPLTIAAASAALRSGSLSCVDLTSACLRAADRLDPQLGTFIARYDESALAAAIAADRELLAGEDRGPLHGIPVGIKDIIACREGPTTANSVVYDPNWWAGLDAPVVSRLRAAGAVIIGKLTTMEYACGYPDPSKPYPLPRNPWDLNTWAGGSSSGSGSGVAAGMFLGSLGTDTGGSIRLPAAFCGISGLKPTYGLVPKSGCLPLGVTLDHIGPMARSAADCAAMLDVIAGFEAGDPSMLPGVKAGDYQGGLNGDLSGLTIGVERVNHLGTRAEDPALERRFEDAVTSLALAGATVVDVELPLFAELSRATLLTWSVEAFAFHRTWLSERWSDYGRWTREVIGAGALLTGADYVQLQKVRRTGKVRLAELFNDIDLIVTPTVACGAVRYDILNRDALFGSLFTYYWNAVGNPVLSVPMGFTADDLPLGLQIAGRPLEDGLVLKAGDAYQRLTDFHLQVPALAGHLVA